MCRIFIESWYESIMARGTDNSIPSFTFLDEFQSICDLSSSRFSDRRFVAESREFKGAVAILTQNVAGLPGLDEDKESLVHNLNTKIMLYNSDPSTSRSINPHVGGALNSVMGEPDILTTLERGEAYVIRYDSDTGRHIAGKEFCNKAHDRLKEALDAIPDGDLKLEAPEIPERASLMGLLRNFSSNPQAANGVKEKRNKGKKPSKAREDAPKMPSHGLQIVREIMEKEEWDMAVAFTSSELVYKRPEFFTDDAEIGLPCGWLPHVENVLLAVSATGLELRIRGIRVEGDKLLTDFDESTSGAAKTLFNSLVKKAGSFCPVCGGFMEPNGMREAICLCPACIRKFGLDGSKPQAKSNAPVSIMRPVN